MCVRACAWFVIRGCTFSTTVATHVVRRFCVTHFTHRRFAVWQGRVPTTTRHARSREPICHKLANMSDVTRLLDAAAAGDAHAAGDLLPFVLSMFFEVTIQCSSLTRTCVPSSESDNLNGAPTSGRQCVQVFSTNEKLENVLRGSWVQIRLKFAKSFRDTFYRDFQQY